MLGRPGEKYGRQLSSVTREQKAQPQIATIPGAYTILRLPVRPKGPILFQHCQLFTPGGLI
jgi:hypothetical protein